MPTVKLFFAWEFGIGGKPVPVLYHGHAPKRDANSIGAPRILTTPVELPLEEVEKLGDGDSFPQWLQDKYPAPSLEDF